MCCEQLPQRDRFSFCYLTFGSPLGLEVQTPRVNYGPVAVSTEAKFSLFRGDVLWSTCAAVWRGKLMGYL